MSNTQFDLKELERLGDESLRLNAIVIAAWNKKLNQSNRPINGEQRAAFLVFRDEYLASNKELSDKISVAEAKATAMLRVAMEHGRQQHLARTGQKDNRATN